MLEPDSAYRISCAVHNELEALYQRCKQQPDYATKASPRVTQYEEHASLVELRVCDVDEKSAESLRACSRPFPIHNGRSRESTIRGHGDSSMWMRFPMIR